VQSEAVLTLHEVFQYKKFVLSEPQEVAIDHEDAHQCLT
jgi:hypothetical protein